MTEIEKYHQRKERQAQLDHRDVVLAIGSIIKTDEGRKFFKYMFKELDVNNLPDLSLDGRMLYEYLGFLRAGNEFYKLASEACHESTAAIMAKIGRETYDDKLEQYRVENSGTDASTDE